MDKPLQVMLGERDHRHLSSWARARGWTKSQAVRVAIRALTRPNENNSLLAASGMIDGLPRNMSEQIDRYLQETYVVRPTRAKQSRAGLRR